MKYDIKLRADSHKKKEGKYRYSKNRSINNNRSISRGKSLHSHNKKDSNTIYKWDNKDNIHINNIYVNTAYFNSI